MSAASVTDLHTVEGDVLVDLPSIKTEDTDVDRVAIL